MGWRRWGVGVATVLACMPATGLAQAPAADGPALDGFDQIVAARRTAEFGRRNRDAFSLLTAARMLGEVPVRDAAGATAGDAAFTPQGLLEEAKALATPETLPLMRLPAARRGVMRSPFGQGLVRTVREVGAGATYAFPVQARSGEALKIGAIGDLRTRMALKLSSARGDVLCLDDAGDYAPVCVLRSGATGDVRVEVRNRGTAPTRAVILSN